MQSWFPKYYKDSKGTIRRSQQEKLLKWGGNLRNKKGVIDKRMLNNSLFPIRSQFELSEGDARHIWGLHFFSFGYSAWPDDEFIIWWPCRFCLIRCLKMWSSRTLCVLALCQASRPVRIALMGTETADWVSSYIFLHRDKEAPGVFLDFEVRKDVQV